MGKNILTETKTNKQLTPKPHSQTHTR